MSIIQTNDYYAEKIEWFRKNGYEEIAPIDYYRLIFPKGSFQKSGESNGDYKPNGLLMYSTRDSPPNSMSTVVINDDLQAIDDCLNRRGRFENYNFVIISGCSYVGRRKTNKNARYCHAIIIDIDEVDCKCLENLIYLMNSGLVPTSTAIVVSGNGVHIVYALDKPIPMFKNKAELLMNVKAILTRTLWNSYTSRVADVQTQGIVQGYRAVGTITKKGHTVKAFRIGKKVSIDELIEATGNIGDIDGCDVYSGRIKKALKNKNIKEDMYSELSCDDRVSMAELLQNPPPWFEVWYQRRIIEKQPPGHIQLGRSAYDKWLTAIKEQAHQGCRRRCIYCLAAISQKCNIPADEFIADAYSLVPLFDTLTVDPGNPFTQADVDSVIAQYRERDLTKMSFAAMERMTGIAYPKTVKSHNLNGKIGRPDKGSVIRDYLNAHPGEKNITKIAKETGVSRPTIYKYFKGE